MTDETPKPVPAGWLEAIEQGEADLAAGRTHDLETALRAWEAEDEAALALKPRSRRRA